MKKVERLLCHVVMALVVFSVQSCDKNLDKVLDLSGDNRPELEKVLEHFEDDPDPLKYKAAQFLIENMPGQYYNVGQGVDYSDSLFLATAGESQNIRTKWFNDHAQPIFQLPADMVYDLTTIKADFLIKAIDDACDVWNAAPWHEEYDESLFFEYVLPYRLNHEPLSDWRQTIKEEYPMLTENYVLTRRGFQLEAEQGDCVACQMKSYVGAAGHKAAMMFEGSSSVSFKFNSRRQTHKRLILKYSTNAHQMKAVVTINGEFFDTLRLAPTRNIESFAEKWFNKALPIKQGENIVTFSNVSDTLCLDYIQLGAVEDYKAGDLVDFSDNYYNIINKQTHHCLTFDTLKTSRQNIIDLKRLSMTDSTQMLRLDYAGYPLWKIGYYKRDSIDVCLEMEFGTSRTLSADSVITAAEYIKRPFQQWIFFPMGNDCYRIMNKHTGMFLDSKTDAATGREYLVQNPYSVKDSQIWKIFKRGKNPYNKTFFKINSAFSEAMRVFDLTHQFEYYIYDSKFQTDASSLFKAKSGKCADETSFSIYLSRYLGIPAAYDFTPHWGNRSNSHSWSVLIGADGKSVPFFMGNVPGDTIHYFYSYIKPKVFRYRYSVNQQLENDLKYEKSVPELFAKSPRIFDVTDEYCATTDVTRPVPKEIQNRRVAYICVFDNRNWVPVDYGVIRDGKVKFKSMGRGIMYMAGLFIDGTIVPFGNPFLLANNGEIKDIEVNEKKLMKMKLLRKYPFMGAQDFFNSRMNGGQFQASNNADFSDSTVLYVHKGITNGNWYSIAIKDKRFYKFLRYMGGKGSFCNINEMEFFDSDGKKIEGTIIGTEGEGWARKENVFDGNILTGFGALSPDGNWVGLALRKPTVISQIHYIGRNDGNGIEVNDEYELLYWSSKHGWVSVGRQVAKENVIYFDNVPAEGLYILKDLTKGVEERIFTYENGKQIWW